MKGKKKDIHFIYNIMSKLFTTENLSYIFGDQALKQYIAFWKGHCRNPFKVVIAITRINSSPNESIKDIKDNREALRIVYQLLRIV